MNYKHLSLEEREKIFCLKHAVFITHYNFVLLREKEQDHKQI